jgi:AcrR family transcriptional regulator
MLVGMGSTTSDGVTPRKPRPRRDEVRTRILGAAAAVVAERGLAAATIDQVATAAGFTKGAVYSNFASKDELFLALLEAQATARVATVEESLLRARDVPEALAAVGAELARADPAATLLAVEFWQRAVRDPAVRPAYVRSRRALRARITEVADGFLRSRPTAQGWDAPSLAVVVMALANGLAFEELADAEAVPPGLAPRVLGAVLSGPAPG